MVSGERLLFNLLKHYDIKKLSKEMLVTCIVKRWRRNMPVQPIGP
jgi:hypothetical protein